MAPSYTSSDMTDADMGKSTKTKKKRKNGGECRRKREKEKGSDKKKFAPSVKVGAG